MSSLRFEKGIFVSFFRLYSPLAIFEIGENKCCNVTLAKSNSKCSYINTWKFDCPPCRTARCAGKRSLQNLYKQPHSRLPIHLKSIPRLFLLTSNKKNNEGMLMKDRRFASELFLSGPTRRRPAVAFVGGDCKYLLRPESH